MEELSQQTPMLGAIRDEGTVLCCHHITSRLLFKLVKIGGKVARVRMPALLISNVTIAKLEEAVAVPQLGHVGEADMYLITVLIQLPLEETTVCSWYVRSLMVLSIVTIVIKMISRTPQWCFSADLWYCILCVFASRSSPHICLDGDKL